MYAGFVWPEAYSVSGVEVGVGRGVGVWGCVGGEGVVSLRKECKLTNIKLGINQLFHVCLFFPAFLGLCTLIISLYDSDFGMSFFFSRE